MTDQDSTLSMRERELLTDLDSRLFGYLKFQTTEEEEKKAVILKAITHFEKILADNHKKSVPAQNGDCGIEPNIYCKLGHLRLLLEDYAKALSAYQKYFQQQEDYWKDVTFLYGLGLVYFHYQAYQWAIKAFQQVLYSEPGFVRANEIHVRLGLMYKFISDNETSLKHFRLALHDSNPATLSKFEIRFHIAHLCEAQQKYRQAKESYEQILELPGLPNNVKANTLRQLGWLYHICDYLGDKTTREAQAIQFLQKSIGTDPTSGQSWYLLGRCYSCSGKVHDAFVSYRHSIDESEASADTWCSIGVLYQQQNQPMDALQAYICAVQLDSSHVAAWTDLGILYENCNQPKDALSCYVNATKNKSCMNPNLTSRIKFLEQQLGNIPIQQLQTKPKTLPSIEEAWSLPIPAELTQRQGASVTAHPQQGPGGDQQKLQQKTWGQNGEFPAGVNLASQTLQQLNQQHQMQQIQMQSGPPTKKRKSTSKTKKSPATPELAAPTPQFYLSAQEMQMLTCFQQNQANLNPQQHQMFQQLQQRYYMQQQHMAQQRQQQMTAPHPAQIGQPPPAYPGMRHPGFQGPNFPMQQSPHLPSVNSGSLPQQPRNIPFTTSAPSTTQGHMTGSHASSISDLDLPKDLLNVQPSSLSDQELTALLSQKDIATSLAEDLLAQFDRHEKSEDSSTGNNNSTDPLKSLMKSDAQTSQSITASANAHYSTAADSKNKMDKKDFLNELSVNTGVSRSKVSNETKSPTSLRIGMSAAEVIQACKGKGKHTVPSTRILSDKLPPPAPPQMPYPPLSKDKLNPPTPSVYLESKKDAFSQELLQYCLSQPVTVIRGLAGALKLDLGLFSTKSLVEANADHLIEVRTQLKQGPDENTDQYGNKMWRCSSSRSHTTIAKYAQYQASTFQESLREESDKAKGIFKDSDSDSNSSMPSGKNGKKKTKTLRFGTNVDLSDETKWKVQLQELTKLPSCFNVVSACNLLSHIGHIILGMNTVQLYMKVPGSRTPGHQENNNFCSINVNIGPGDCEWFAVPEQYWGIIHNLCEKNNINYLSGSWWPLLEDLYEDNVPVYRFIQKPGDLVWVNTGTVHWVQAIGWCNNIAWNVGPMTGRSYQQAVERYEWNKLQSYKSIVPLIHLSWNLARNVNIAEPKLFEQMKYCLMRTLRQTQLMVDYVENHGKEVKWHGQKADEPAHYCNNCEVEVFNLLFVTELDKKFVVHCMDCALKMSPKLERFTVLNQHKLEDLMETYDCFQLHVNVPISCAS